ncbi:T7SS effector LXG polymorphic toxin [Enterococcus rivorum]|uniref:T7SS effector LXG polymorphic toxin n=2 Tax=Enterococcus rivorum TaxID=762845 RepID=UPI00360B3842
MVKFRYSEWQGIASEMTQLRLAVLAQLNSFRQAQQVFQGAEKLSGAGWDSTRSYFDAYSEVSSTIGHALNTLEDTITAYLGGFTNEVGAAENDLDTDKMEALKAELRRLQAENDFLMEALAKAFEDVPFVNQFFNRQSMLGTAKKIEILEKYQAFENAHSNDFAEVQSVISSVGEGVAFLGTAGNFVGGKEGYKKIDFANKAWYKTLKAFNQKQPKMREEIVINTDGERPIYEVYVNGKKDTKKTKELQEMFRVHNVELFKEYGPEIFKILMNLDDVEIILDKDSTTMQRSSSSVFLLLSILPPDKVKDFLKTAKLLAKGEHSMDAIKLSAKEWQILKDFEKSADTLKVIKKTSKANIGKDFGKIGIYVEKPNVKINWSEHAVHGMERLNQRGLTKLQVDDFIQNGKVLSQNNGAKFAFITEDGVAIVSKDGKLVTAWGVSDFDDGMKEIVKQLFGK